MDNIVKKSVQIKGSLKTGRLIYKPYPTNEFIESFRLLAIGSVSFVSNEQFESSLTVSCNFIKSQSYNKDYKIISYQQPLQSFLVNNRKLQVKNFDLVWFLINSVSEELVFTFENFEQQIMAKDIDVTLTLYFR